ncbi:MAG: sugar phosphate isomerase/epimerase and 4-hydroxyphenylpyruvate domain-containing protein [Kineosporiaceae bacterium]|nr:sugar phosphate isomerase/epimerase and 4-hydroxyphenylpyruvate domain-containing protein [Kineosporiaceae bacterium]
MKLPAIAAAGFDGIEVFEPDLIASPTSPADLRRRCADLGLSIDLYQPMRDMEAVPAEEFAANLRRARAKFAVMQQLGCDLVLACSSVAPTAIDDDDLAAEQLHALAECAAEHGIRVAYEALAWGRYVNTWDHSWDLVRRADHPGLGICLDSFHILARGSDTAGIAEIDGNRLFFLQLSDAPTLDLGVLAWSRHHRLYPGQGAFDLVDLTAKALAAGYRGPLSLEVFNDVFRQADPGPTAVDARRSLLALAEDLAVEPLVPEPVRSRLGVPPAASPATGCAFCEVGIDAASSESMTNLLRGMGFRAEARHVKQDVTLWRQGGITLLTSSEDADPRVPGRGQVAALGLYCADADRAAQRALALGAVPPAPEPLIDSLPGVVAPDATRIYFCGPDDSSWSSVFEPVAEHDRDPGANAAGETWDGVGLVALDHVSMTQPFDSFDEARQFYARVVGLQAQDLVEYAAPFGLLRGRAMCSPDGAVRIPLSTSLVRRGGWTPGLRGPQHVAFRSEDIVATARRLRSAGVPLMEVPDNYYADLAARFDLSPDRLAEWRRLGLLYDRDGSGELLHLYTQVIGSRVFFEVVQRIGGYEGYGAANAPIHIAAHHRQRHPD